MQVGAYHSIDEVSSLEDASDAEDLEELKRWRAARDWSRRDALQSQERDFHSYSGQGGREASPLGKSGARSGARVQVGCAASGRTFTTSALSAASCVRMCA